MERREFLVLGLGLAVTSFSKGLDGENNSHLELTGRRAPLLFGKSHRLVNKASLAFERMRVEALKSGINLHSVSSYRNFEKQTALWNTKFDRYKASGLSETDCLKKILEYSALPGASRHHWGTDIDLSDLNVMQPDDVLNPKHFKTGGVYEKLGEWLDKNAASFGFYEAYTNEPERKGFKYEPWHYSYAEIATELLKKFQDLDFNTHIKDEKVKGHQLMDEEFWLNYKSDYVFGINPILKP